MLQTPVKAAAQIMVVHNTVVPMSVDGVITPMPIRDGTGVAVNHTIRSFPTPAPARPVAKTGRR